MINIVYVDVYFCFNFIMDFFVLYVMRLMLKEGGISAKDTAAALVGASYSTVILIIGNGNILEALFTYLVIPCLMIFISSGRKDIKTLAKRLGVLYLFTFIISGVINAIYYGSVMGKSLIEKTLQIQIGSLNIWLITTVIISGISIVKIFRILIIRNLYLGQKLYEVTIVIGTNSIRGKGLLDTGNELLEPITKKPVFIIEYNLIKHIDTSLFNPIFIPYNSVGKEHGLMEGFVGDYIDVEGYCIDKPIIGIHKGKLSRESRYNMILPPNICKGESK